MEDKEGTGRLRELELLEALAENPEARQVDLATRLGVAVGTVNWLLKRLTSKGYVKVKRIGQWRWHYLLTPRGLAEKTKLTRQYLRYSMRLYRQTRQETRRILEEARKRGYGEVLLDGTDESDLLDVCRLTCLEQKVAILNEKDNPSKNEAPVLRIEGRRINVHWPGDVDERGSNSVETRSST